LKHPGVVRVLPIPLTGHKESLFFAKAANIPGQPWYYAMEYLGGGPLSSLTRHKKRLPYPFVAALGARVCKILDYIHSQGMVHLDIKPDNIIFRQPLIKNRPFDPVMIDFGVAAKSLQKGAAGGTLVFMAPEYIRKNHGTLPPEVNIDLKRVDIYALGVVIYKLWTGQYPFGGLSDKVVSTNILTQNILPPRSLNPDLPPSADKLMLEWLCKDPFQRPTLIEIERDLNYISQGMTLYPDNLNPPSGRYSFWQFWKK
jgi:serine/threonine-protein kinase